MATRTHFVRGFDQLAHRLSRPATRTLVLTSPRRRFVAELTQKLAAPEVRVFDRAQVHVPIEVLEAADRELGDADTLVALGGGAAIGLGKALRVRHPHLHFIAVPTTYSGSEMTSMYGVTSGTTKETGRSDAARPDDVFYDAELTRDLPLALTIQSLTNGIAHVASVLSSRPLDAAARADAEAAAIVVRAIEQLIADPASLAARELALRGASACGAVFERGKPGAQHGLAHLLGGALRVEHAALHSMLLPHFIAHLRETQPPLVSALESVLEISIRDIYTGERRPERELDCYLHDILTRAGAPVALTALGGQVTREAVEAALATRPELPAQIALDALHGLRPPGALGRSYLGSEPDALVVGCAPRNARVIVLALHGRGAEAGTIARRYRDIADDPEVSILALRAEHGASRWYEIRYGEPKASSDPEAKLAIERVEIALLHLRRYQVPLVLAGFSQGACLALEVAARSSGLAGVLAPCGARLGRPEEWARRDARSAFRGMPVVAGAALEDRWIAQPDLDATIAWFRAAGAEVDDLRAPGDKHEITAAQRERIRALLRRA